MHHILVIDDEDLVRKLIHGVLAKHGFEISEAASAAQGILRARRDLPNMILLDLEMPGQDGVSCLRVLRDDPVTRHIPVLIITATPVREKILRVAKIGVEGIILKDADMVKSIVERARFLARKCDPQVPAPYEAPAPDEKKQSEAATPPRTLPAAVPHCSDASPRVKTPSQSVPVSEAEESESLLAGVLQLNADGDDLESAVQKLKSLKPLMSRSQLRERVLEGTELRALKPAVQQVLTLTGSSTASISSISKGIKQDQALAIKVLKVANSPAYTRGERVDTVQKAVARIGVAQIRSTVLSLSVIESLEHTKLAGRIRADWFWEHSIACGLIGSKIARFRGLSTEQVDGMFIAGLLHDVGRIIYAERLGDEYQSVIRTADELGLPLETVESRLLLVNHADLTDKLLREWHFSPELVNPIALHHLSVGNIRRIAPRMAESVATLGLANRLAHALVLGSSGNDSLYPIEEFLDFLRLTPEHVDEICAVIPEETADAKLQMFSHGAHLSASILDQARSQISPDIRVLHVSASRARGATDILLDRLVPGSGSEVPNLAIVRISHVQERTQLICALRAAEQTRGIEALPTLVVATGQGSFFAEGMLGERPVTQTVVPVRMERMIAMLNDLLRPRGT